MLLVVVIVAEVCVAIPPSKRSLAPSIISHKPAYPQCLQIMRIN